MNYRGHTIRVFQQFVGAWLADCVGPVVTLQVPGFTRTRAIAKCKAEIFHAHRYDRISATGDRYWRRLSDRCERRGGWTAKYRRNTYERFLSVAP